jgi:type I restriction enzyme S subunit
LTSTTERSSRSAERLPGGWPLKTFEELLAEPVRNGIYKKKEFHGRGQKIVNMGELFAHDFISNQEMKRVELNPKEKSKSLLHSGDLLFARRSLVLEGSGKCSLVLKLSEDTTFESSIIRARLDQSKADPRFYYYLWRSPLGRALMASIATRTAVSGITGSNLIKLMVPHPPLPTQHKIASVLSAYDDLIENNTRRIGILEEMAQAIYREWFVNFRFPGHEKVEMVDTELGLIPESWQVQKLGELVRIQKGKKARQQFGEPRPGTIPYLLIDGLKSGDHIYTDDQKLPVADKDDVVMVMDGASSGTVFIGFHGAVGSTLAYFRPQDKRLLSPYLLYLFLRYHHRQISDNNVGSAIPHANKDFLKGMSMTLPPEGIKLKAHQMLASVFTQVQTLQDKNVNLRRTRDLLLPKLVSGEVDVEELNAEVPG